jgi:hypothetical protein
MRLPLAIAWRLPVDCIDVFLARIQCNFNMALELFNQDRAKVEDYIYKVAIRSIVLEDGVSEDEAIQRLQGTSPMRQLSLMSYEALEALDAKFQSVVESFL